MSYTSSPASQELLLKEIPLLGEMSRRDKRVAAPAKGKPFFAPLALKGGCQDVNPDRGDYPQIIR